MSAASLCDACKRPGMCCTQFSLSAGDMRSGTPEEIDRQLATIVTVDNGDRGCGILGFGAKVYEEAAAADHPPAGLRLGLPFKRRYFDAAYNRWTYYCTLLDRSGRCGDYENRPGLCKSFRAGVDHPCTHTVYGPERSVARIPRHDFLVMESIRKLPPGMEPYDHRVQRAMERVKRFKAKAVPCPAK